MNQFRCLGYIVVVYITLSQNIWLCKECSSWWIVFKHWRKMNIELLLCCIASFRQLCRKIERQTKLVKKKNLTVIFTFFPSFPQGSEVSRCRKKTQSIPKLFISEGLSMACQQVGRVGWRKNINISLIVCVKERGCNFTLFKYGLLAASVAGKAFFLSVFIWSVIERV